MPISQSEEQVSDLVFGQAKGNDHDDLEEMELNLSKLAEIYRAKIVEH